ncbi:hypothetical protein AB0M91_19740 [Micromonospora rifamycinica]|uniref:hypothetical protein n=1 Tax=Micromonospora rifamycinica TaxID=291594 RepID=UPI00343BE27F
MQPQTLPDTTTPPAEPARDLTAATALLRRLYAAGWEGDYVGAGHFGGTEYAICHGAGGQAAVVLDGLNQVMELRISGTVMTLDQAVVAVDAAGLAPAAPTTDPQPSGRLLAAVREVIAAGHLSYDGTGVDVDRVQGEAHARLVAAYEAVTGETADTTPDYWTRLADDIHRAADRIATLAGTPHPEIVANLHISVGAYTTTPSADWPAVVDRIAAAFDTTAEPKKSGSSWEHLATARLGALRVHPYARIPSPEDTQLSAAQARIAELEAQLAAGGTR